MGYPPGQLDGVPSPPPGAGRGTPHLELDGVPPPPGAGRGTPPAWSWTGYPPCEQTHKVKILPPLVLRTRSVMMGTAISQHPTGSTCSSNWFANSCHPRTKYDGRIGIYRCLSINIGSIPCSLVPRLWFLVLFTAPLRQPEQGYLPPPRTHRTMTDVCQRRYASRGHSGGLSY